MSGSARTTTYVSAAVTRTASVARTTTGSPGTARVPAAASRSAGGRRGDLDIGTEIAQVEREAGVLALLEERTGELGPAQFAALGGDREAGLHGRARIRAG